MFFIKDKLFIENRIVLYHKIVIFFLLLPFLTNPLSVKANTTDKGNYSIYKKKNNLNSIVVTRNVLKDLTEGKANNYENTHLIITDNFDLRGKTIALPNNVVLAFEGGGLRNGEIVGCNTSIIAGIEDIFGSKTTLKGVWTITEVYPEWFGAHHNGADCTEAFRAVSSSCRNTNVKKILLSENIYYTQTIVLSNRFHLTGSSKSRNATIVQYGNHPDLPLIKTDGEGGGYITIENITVKSSGTRTAYTVNITNVHSTTIENCSFEKDKKLGLSTPIDKNGVFIGREDGFSGNIFMTRFLKNRLNQCCVKIEGTDGYIAYNEIWGIDCLYGLCLDKSGNHMINSNQIIGGKEGCIFITGYCTALKIYGNYFDGSSGTNSVTVPYGIHSVANTFKNNIISNNNFWHLSGPALSLKSSESDVIIGNVFDDCDWDCGCLPDIEIQNAKNTSVTSNVFVRTDIHGRTTEEPASPIILRKQDESHPTLINGNTMNGLKYYTYCEFPLSIGRANGAVKTVNNSNVFFDITSNPNR